MKEKVKNTETISDSQETQTAVAQAVAVLKEFYAKAAEATALLPQQPESPEIFDKPYKGMGGESGGVVDMLEVIGPILLALRLTPRLPRLLHRRSMVS